MKIEIYANISGIHFRNEVWFGWIFRLFHNTSRNTRKLTVVLKITWPLSGVLKETNKSKGSQWVFYFLNIAAGETEHYILQLIKFDERNPVRQSRKLIHLISKIPSFKTIQTSLLPLFTIHFLILIQPVMERTFSFPGTKRMKQSIRN